MRNFRILSLTFIFSCISLSLPAQFLKKLKDRVQDEVIDKVADRVANEIADKVAEDLANRIYKPLDKAIEDAYREEMSDSLGNDQDGEAFSRFMTKYADASKKIQPSYKFDIINHMEVRDHDGEVNEMKMYYTKEGEYFGMETLSS